MNKFVALLTKKETAKKEREMTTTFFQLYSMHIRNYDNSFSILYSLTCLNKDTSVLLQVINS